ncbi:acryloyl-CoA reductase [Ramlibacter tataouinensis]|uniref:acrylyl-CoA reductase family protein n=1 Tax=Ramlibacter tataouinensis TaxID=94132 RepID=UPI0022F3A170|nr:acryloyl-CoA reductase [Ramlibacter tataouinensis]WBY01077.1 acryloyl-CoA reductase [Ramlibacter tataouinensis]
MHTIDGKPVCKFEQLTLDDIDPGPVVIRTAFSAITYKDAMAARGFGKNVRTDRPCVTGVDLSGVVVGSADERFREGEQVVVTNYQLGTLHDGAYADYARVPAEWVVPLPKGLSLYEAMGLGTSGLTAALAVDRFEKAGLKPGDGPVAVTGASGGVGSLAIDMLAGKGYEVVAISGKAEQTDYLKAIGAARVIARDDFMKDKAPLVSAPPFAGALDNVGGAMLDRLAANLMPNGKVAVAGMVGVELTTTVLPLVLRSIDILGINVSRQLKMPERRRLWERMATDLKPRHFDRICRPIAFTELDNTMDSFFKVSSVGRVVVEVGSKAPG